MNLACAHADGVLIIQARCEAASLPVELQRKVKKRRSSFVVRKIEVYLLKDPSDRQALKMGKGEYCFIFSRDEFCVYKEVIGLLRLKSSYCCEVGET